MAQRGAPGPRGNVAGAGSTRERIVRTATTILLSEGLSGFKLDLVRDAASVSGSQINHYFTDKSDLIREVVDRQADDMVRLHRHPALGDLDTFDDWEHWIDINLRYLHRRRQRGTATYHTLVG